MLLVVRGTALFITDGFPQRTWSAGGHWLADVLVGDFYVGPFRVYMSLFWFIAAAIVLGYVLTQTEGRQLDPGVGRQRRRGAGARRQRQPHQDLRSSCSRR